MSEADKNFCTLPLPAADTPAKDQGQGARIYGKATCPHTTRARNALPLAVFLDVEADPEALAEMLRLSGGARRIPVIARGENITIGFKRGA
jgi:glutaredoxin 3